MYTVFEKPLKYLLYLVIITIFPTHPFHLIHSLHSLPCIVWREGQRPSFLSPSHFLFVSLWLLFLSPQTYLAISLKLRNALLCMDHPDWNLEILKCAQEQEVQVVKKLDPFSKLNPLAAGVCNKLMILHKKKCAVRFSHKNYPKMREWQQLLRLLNF